MRLHHVNIVSPDMHGLEVLGTAELSPIPSLRPAAEIIRWLARSGRASRRAPLGAQAVAIADAFDALTAGRRPRRSQAEALATVRDDPERRWKDPVVDALERAIGSSSPRAARRRRSDRGTAERVKGAA